jgi:hypothetical protein
MQVRRDEQGDNEQICLLVPCSAYWIEIIAIKLIRYCSDGKLKKEVKKWTNDWSAKSQSWAATHCMQSKVNHPSHSVRVKQNIGG